MFLRLSVLLVVLLFGLSFGLPYRPTRWVPRAFWHPQKRGIFSSGVRQFHSRPHRSDASFEYPVVEDSMPAYDYEYDPQPDLIAEKRGKYDDNKSYGFWISALNKAGNVKKSMRQRLGAKN